ncbi:MAG TPA: nuclear transport factor 2 family protein [Dehalococcoidales bacterium]|nr:nuclear transport factor 2 family protein [Dehalococcoidales bacterium]
MVMPLQQMEEEIKLLREQVKAGLRARDELEICKLQSLYSHYYNFGMRSEIPLLFAQHTPGVNMEIEDSGVYDNIESITRFWNTVFARKSHFTVGFMALHMTCNPVIEINRDGTLARGVWHSHGYCALRIGKLTPFMCLGKYDMEYVKEDGQWRILKFAYRQTFMSPMDKGFIEAPSVGSIAAHPENRPDKPTTFHMPYHQDRINIPQPPPPEPYKD